MPVARVKEQMQRRAGEMSASDVVVYVSCIKVKHSDGRKPRYLVAFSVEFLPDAATNTIKSSQTLDLRKMCSSDTVNASKCLKFICLD